MAFSVTDFRSKLTGGGALPTLFQVNIDNPVDPSADAITPFMVKAAQIPSSTLGLINIPYMGRKIKVKGDRTFDEPWTVTIINDEDNLVRNAVETWSNAINAHESNTLGFESTNPEEYKVQAQVHQYSKDGSILRTYNFVGMWPSEISTIELGWENNDTIEEFTVTFQYDYWEISAGGRTGQSTS